MIAPASAWQLRSIPRSPAYRSRPCWSGWPTCGVCSCRSPWTTAPSARTGCLTLGPASRTCICPFIRPGEPNENAYIESFNGKFREERLNQYWFISMEQARHIIEDWRNEYNTERSHRYLGNLTPEEFARNKDRAFLTADSNASPY